MTTHDTVAEKIGDVSPLSEVNPGFRQVIAAELHGLIDFQNPAYMLGRWATLGCMVAGVTEIIQIAHH